MSSNTKHFVYHASLYSNQENILHRSDAPVTEEYHNDLYYSNQSGSPYFNFTRGIQVFKPASGKIDDMIVINDAIPYLMTGMLNRFEKMVNENKLSANTALVFVHPLPGLEKTLSGKVAEAYNNDPSRNLSGMGIRLIDYKHGIEQYVDFIAKLFEQLKNELGNEKINVPDDPHHRLMIGSSLSGTASIYIASYPHLFGGVIAQSPSPDNREILSKRPSEMLIGKNIYLSCGKFEHPDYAAANDNLGYATELSHKLKLGLPHTAESGHQFIAWNEELEKSVPNVLKAMHSVKAKKSALASQSIFTHSNSSSPSTATEAEKKLVNRLRGG